MKKVSLVYFQHDLRIHDHPGLSQAKKSGLPIVGVYLLNSTELQNTKWGFLKMGPHRQQFLFESLITLKQNLSQLHIPFFVFTKDEKIAAKHLQEHYEIDAIYAAIEPGREEQNLFQSFQKALGIKKVLLSHDKPLLSPEHYPWLLTQLPGRFTDARIKIESLINVQPILPTISPQSPIEGMADDFAEITNHPFEENTLMKGGEDAALLHLNQYFF